MKISSQIQKLSKEIKSGYEIESVYLHLGNGGATISVEDAGFGPEFIVSISSFGGMSSEIRISTDIVGLKAIAKIVQSASEYTGFSETYINGCFLEVSKKDRIEDMGDLVFLKK